MTSFIFGIAGQVANLLKNIQRTSGRRKSLSLLDSPLFDHKGTKSQRLEGKTLWLGDFVVKLLTDVTQCSIPKGWHNSSVRIWHPFGVILNVLHKSIIIPLLRSFFAQRYHQLFNYQTNHHRHHPRLHCHHGRRYKWHHAMWMYGKYGTMYCHD